MWVELCMDKGGLRSNAVWRARGTGQRIGPTFLHAFAPSVCGMTPAANVECQSAESTCRTSASSSLAAPLVLWEDILCEVDDHAHFPLCTLYSCMRVGARCTVGATCKNNG